MPSINKNNVEIYKPIEIPKQISEIPDVRFILINKKEGQRKKPREKGFLIENNYAIDSLKLRGWLLGGGNYGILTGRGNLQCFDADELDRLQELGIIAKIPKTFTTKTGSGGIHKWLIIKGLTKRITMHDPVLKNEKGLPLHLGEIQSSGQFAVGPGSIHNNGRKYEIVDDSPVAEITIEELKILLGDNVQTRWSKKEIVANIQPEKKQKYHTQHDVDITDIATPNNATKNGDELIGANPFHGSKGGRNFHVNTKKNVWRCYACQSGGGWAELLAVKEGIISCQDAGKGCLSRLQYKQIIQIAIDKGLIRDEPIATTHDEPVWGVFTTVVKELPKRCPDEGLTVIKAPPRTGKTHTIVTWMKQTGSANYFTHRHAIIEHAVKIAREINMTSVVWVVGIKQDGACRTGTHDCTTCPLKPTQETFMQQQIEAQKLLWREKILTTKEIPVEYCPYYLLKMAEPSADYCFTVINNIKRIETRENIFIDEDPTVDYFYPHSIELAVMKNVAGEYHVKNGLEAIEQELKNVNEMGKQPRLKKYTAILKSIYDVIADQEVKTIEDKAEKIEEILTAGEIPPSGYSDPAGESSGDDVTLEAAVRAISHVYKACPVSISTVHGGYKTLHLIANEANAVFDVELIESAKRLVIIGATKAMLFAASHKGKCIEIDEFRYKDRFMVLAVDTPNGVEQRGAVQAQKHRVIKVAASLWRPENDKRQPFLMLTGSKRAQESAMGKIKGSIGARIEKENALHWNYATGAPVVFFQNSVISRGLDVDQYNLLLAYDTNFAQPFWSIHDRAVADSIIKDETTNSVLRISPTLRNDKQHLKLIVMPSSDVWKVSYLDGRIRTTALDDENLARIIDHFGVTGVIKMRKGEGVKIETGGIYYKSSQERLLVYLSGEEVVHNPSEVEIAMRQLTQTLKSAKSSHRSPTMNTTMLISEVCEKSHYPYEVVRHALQQLYIKGVLLMAKHGKEHRWKLAQSRE